MKVNERVGCSSIRNILADDLEMILTWRNSDHVRLMMNRTDIISMEEHLKYYETIKNITPPRQLLYLFCDKPVGFISTKIIDKESGILDAGYYLGERGLSLKASFGIIYCALDYAFDTLNALEICGEVRKTNITSIMLDKKCGFLISEDSDNEKEDFLKVTINRNTWNKYRDSIRRII